MTNRKPATNTRGTIPSLAASSAGECVEKLNMNGHTYTMFVYNKEEMSCVGYSAPYQSTQIDVVQGNDLYIKEPGWRKFIFFK